MPSFEKYEMPQGGYLQIHDEQLKREFGDVKFDLSGVDWDDLSKKLIKEVENVKDVKLITKDTIPSQYNKGVSDAGAFLGDDGFLYVILDNVDDIDKVVKHEKAHKLIEPLASEGTHTIVPDDMSEIHRITLNNIGREIEANILTYKTYGFPKNITHDLEYQLYLHTNDGLPKEFLFEIINTLFKSQDVPSQWKMDWAILKETYNPEKSNYVKIHKYRRATPYDPAGDVASQYQWMQQQAQQSQQTQAPVQAPVVPAGAPIDLFGMPTPQPTPTPTPAPTPTPTTAPVYTPEQIKQASLYGIDLSQPKTTTPEAPKQTIQDMWQGAIKETTKPKETTVQTATAQVTKVEVPQTNIKVVSPTTGEGKYQVVVSKPEGNITTVMTTGELSKAGVNIPKEIEVANQVHQAVMKGELTYDQAIEKYVDEPRAKELGMSLQELKTSLGNMFGTQEMLQRFADKWNLTITQARDLINEYNENPDANAFTSKNPNFNKWIGQDLKIMSSVGKGIYDNVAINLAWQKLNDATNKNPSILRTIWQDGQQYNVLNLEEAAKSGLSAEMLNLAGSVSPPTIVKVNAYDKGTIFDGGFGGITQNQIAQLQRYADKDLYTIVGTESGDTSFIENKELESIKENTPKLYDILLKQGSKAYEDKLNALNETFSSYIVPSTDGKVNYDLQSIVLAVNTGKLSKEDADTYFGKYYENAIKWNNIAEKSLQDNQKQVQQYSDSKGLGIKDAQNMSQSDVDKYVQSGGDLTLLVASGVNPDYVQKSISESQKRYDEIISAQSALLPYTDWAKGKDPIELMGQLTSGQTDISSQMSNLLGGMTINQLAKFQREHPNDTTTIKAIFNDDKLINSIKDYNKKLDATIKDIDNIFVMKPTDYKSRTKLAGNEYSLQQAMEKSGAKFTDEDNKFLALQQNIGATLTNKRLQEIWNSLTPEQKDKATGIYSDDINKDNYFSKTVSTMQEIQADVEKSGFGGKMVSMLGFVPVTGVLGAPAKQMNLESAKAYLNDYYKNELEVVKDYRNKDGTINIGKLNDAIISNPQLKDKILKDTGYENFDDLRTNLEGYNNGIKVTALEWAESGATLALDALMIGGGELAGLGTPLFTIGKTAFTTGGVVLGGISLGTAGIFVPSTIKTVKNPEVKGGEKALAIGGELLLIGGGLLGLAGKTPREKVTFTNLEKAKIGETKSIDGKSVTSEIGKPSVAQLERPVTPTSIQKAVDTVYQSSYNIGKIINEAKPVVQTVIQDAIKAGKYIRYDLGNDIIGIANFVKDELPSRIKDFSKQGIENAINSAMVVKWNIKYGISDVTANAIRNSKEFISELASDVKGAYDEAIRNAQTIKYVVKYELPENIKVTLSDTVQKLAETAKTIGWNTKYGISDEATRVFLSSKEFANTLGESISNNLSTISWNLKYGIPDEVIRGLLASKEFVSNVADNARVLGWNTKYGISDEAIRALLSSKEIANNLASNVKNGISNIYDSVSRNALSAEWYAKYELKDAVAQSVNKILEDARTLGWNTKYGISDEAIRALIASKEFAKYVADKTSEYGTQLKDFTKEQIDNLVTDLKIGKWNVQYGIPEAFKEVWDRIGETVKDTAKNTYNKALNEALATKWYLENDLPDTIHNAVSNALDNARAIGWNAKYGISDEVVRAFISSKDFVKFLTEEVKLTADNVKNMTVEQVQNAINQAMIAKWNLKYNIPDTIAKALVDSKEIIYNIASNIKDNVGRGEKIAEWYIKNELPDAVNNALKDTLSKIKDNASIVAWNTKYGISDEAIRALLTSQEFMSKLWNEISTNLAMIKWDIRYGISDEVKSIVNDAITNTLKAKDYVVKGVPATTRELIAGSKELLALIGDDIREAISQRWNKITSTLESARIETVEGFKEGLAGKPREYTYVQALIDDINARKMLLRNAVIASNIASKPQPSVKTISEIKGLDEIRTSKSKELATQQRILDEMFSKQDEFVQLLKKQSGDEVSRAYIDWVESVKEYANKKLELEQTRRFVDDILLSNPEKNEITLLEELNNKIKELQGQLPELENTARARGQELIKVQEPFIKTEDSLVKEQIKDNINNSVNDIKGVTSEIANPRDVNVIRNEISQINQTIDEIRKTSKGEIEGIESKASALKKQIEATTNASDKAILQKEYNDLRSSNPQIERLLKLDELKDELRWRRLGDTKELTNAEIQLDKLIKDILGNKDSKLIESYNQFNKDLTQLAELNKKYLSATNEIDKLDYQLQIDSLNDSIKNTNSLFVKRLGEVAPDVLENYIQLKKLIAESVYRTTGELERYTQVGVGGKRFYQESPKGTDFGKIMYDLDYTIGQIQDKIKNAELAKTLTEKLNNLKDRVSKGEFSEKTEMADKELSGILDDKTASPSDKSRLDNILNEIQKPSDKRLEELKRIGEIEKEARKPEWQRIQEEKVKQYKELGYEQKDGKYWKEIKEGEPQEVGGNFRMDMSTGKNYREITKAEYDKAIGLEEQTKKEFVEKEGIGFTPKPQEPSPIESSGGVATKEKITTKPIEPISPQARQALEKAREKVKLTENKPVIDSIKSGNADILATNSKGDMYIFSVSPKLIPNISKLGAFVKVIEINPEETKKLKDDGIIEEFVVPSIKQGTQLPEIEIPSISGAIIPSVSPLEIGFTQPIEVIPIQKEITTGMEFITPKQPEVSKPPEKGFEPIPEPKVPTKTGETIQPVTKTGLQESYPTQIARISNVLAYNLVKNKVAERTTVTEEIEKILQDVEQTEEYKKLAEEIQKYLEDEEKRKELEEQIKRQIEEILEEEEKKRSIEPKPEYEPVRVDIPVPKEEPVKTIFEETAKEDNLGISQGVSELVEGIIGEEAISTYINNSDGGALTGYKVKPAGKPFDAQELKIRVESQPDISTVVLTNMLSKQEEKSATGTETTTKQEIKQEVEPLEKDLTKVEQLSFISPEEKTQVQQETKIEEKPKEITQEQTKIQEETKTAIEPETKTEYETKTRLEQKTKVEEKIKTDEFTKIKPPHPIFDIDTKILGGGEKKVKIPYGALTWRQGNHYGYITQEELAKPDVKKEIIWLKEGEAPEGLYKFATGKGSAKKTLQVLPQGARLPTDEATVDMGWATVNIKQDIDGTLSMDFAGGKEAVEERWAQEAEQQEALEQALIQQNRPQVIVVNAGQPQQTKSQVPEETVGKSLNKQLLPEYSQGDIKVYTVDDAWIRNEYADKSIGDRNGIDFVLAGHNFVYYDLIPENEVWVSQYLLGKDREAVIIHELAELKKMKEDAEKKEKEHLTYDEYANIHEEVANPVEIEVRKNPEKAPKILKEQLGYEPEEEKEPDIAEIVSEAVETGIRKVNGRIRKPKNFDKMMEERWQDESEEETHRPVRRSRRVNNQNTSGLKKRYYLGHELPDNGLGY